MVRGQRRADLSPFSRGLRRARTARTPQCGLAPLVYRGRTAWNLGGSTLGGLPDWIQDAHYPTCPRCEKTMYFLAMLTGDDLWGESAEGCDYVFFCASGCGTTAVVYQQS